MNNKTCRPPGKRSRRDLNIMARERNYTSYQKGIIKRYYEHRDDQVVARISEIVSDLFLVEGDRKTDALWRRAEAALVASGVDRRRVDGIIRQRNVDELAAIAKELFGAKPKTSLPRRQNHR